MAMMRHILTLFLLAGLLMGCGGQQIVNVEITPMSNLTLPATPKTVSNTTPTASVPEQTSTLSVGPKLQNTTAAPKMAAAPATSVSAPPVDTASAVTSPPVDMTGINSMHSLLRAEDSNIRFGTQADPATVTLGPTDGGVSEYPPYDGKNSLNFKMPKMTPVLAPLDVRFVGFKNRSANYRQRPGFRVSPFDDLELCFESVSDDWPGLVLCVYHLYTTPLLQAHLDNEACGIQESWDGGGAEKGRIYYLKNATEVSRRAPESCEPLLGSVIERGGVIGYSGQVGTNPHSGFRFKVRSEDQNPLTATGDPYLHWVQPSVFFYWQCFELDAIFQPGVLAYPFDCESIQASVRPEQ